MRPFKPHVTDLPDAKAEFSDCISLLQIHLCRRLHYEGISFINDLILEIITFWRPYPTRCKYTTLISTFFKNHVATSHRLFHDWRTTGPGSPRCCSKSNIWTWVTGDVWRSSWSSQTWKALRIQNLKTNWNFTRSSMNHHRKE